VLGLTPKRRIENGKIYPASQLKELSAGPDPYTRKMKKKKPNIFKKLLARFAPVLYARLAYKKATGKKLNLKHPETFNEKLIWIKLFYKNPLMIKCTDKVAMRDYVRDKGLEHILPKIHGIYDSPSDILWDSLPERFALKCNHGCEYNVLCKDKKEFDIDSAEKNLRKWVKTDFSLYANEPHYRHIVPKILCEEYLDDGGEVPNDYKVYCFNGEPKVIVACSGRQSDLLFEFYDLEWNPLDIHVDENKQTIRRPEGLEEMIRYSRILSESFPFVRIDFYDVDSRPVLGEMTFTPSAGMWSFYNDYGQQLLGGFLILPGKES